MLVDRESVRWYRQRAGHLDERLPAGSLAAAARDGLQDSSPWSGVLALHARVRDVPAGAWEDAQLAQVFGPRGAIYLVPRADLPVFTLGQLPRAADRLAAIAADAARYCRVIADSGVLPNSRRVRWAGATGRLLPRWDASTTDITVAPPPEADPEECRLELARRFLHAGGPVGAAHLQWYTGGTRADAETTLAALRSELVSVEVGGDARWILRSDADHLARARPPRGVRLLPPDDPYLVRADKALVVEEARRRAELWPRAPAPGAVLVDGEVCGTWRRKGRQVTVSPWRPPPAIEAAVAGEVARMPLPGPPESASVTWVT